MNAKPATPAFKGLIITAIIVLAGLIIYFSNALGADTFRLIFWIESALLFVAVIISTIIFARQMKGQVLFGNVFAEGFKTTAVVICLFAICNIIITMIIFPGIAGRTVGMIKQSLVKSNQLDSSHADENLGPLKNHFTAILTGISILCFGISGALGAATGAIFANKKQQPAT